MGRKETDEKISNFWLENKMFERSVKERPVDKEYVFYDGPPFATGTPHQGHILGLTSKDLFPRYWTMKGFRVNRRWGWDCHGLPIENIAEKELGIKDKREIIEMGVDKFNEFCRSKVLHYVSEWKKTVTRNGNWIEFDNSYKTMDQSYMESVWKLLKTLYDNGDVYEGKKILMYCPRCQTPLANSEIQMDNSYKDVTEKTATVGFKIKGSDESLLVWTTTPWTLIGNAAIAINPKLEYVKVDSMGKKYILAKELVEKNFKHAQIIESVDAKKLIGVEYEPLYEMDVGGKKGFYVIDGGDEVTAEEGTGLVHMAIYGDFDYEMIKKYDLPVIQHIGKDGKLKLGPESWIGKWFKNVDKEVLEDLEKRAMLVSSASYTHSYPFCYRCETPLIYNAVDSWFISIQKVKDKLLKKAESINWFPENIKEGRFKYILETAPDWSISRNRFWATAIPIWKCECGEEKIIGSIDELQKNAIEKVNADVDLHKHIVDKIHLKCTCGKSMTRIPEVLDCWVESGAMPYASKHYPFENKDWMKDHFPADFISEYIGQVRAWFYYMHVLGVLYMDKAPFEHVVVSGNMLAKDGNKMSKSKKNYTDPMKLYDDYGADALRFYLMSSPLMRAQDMNFNDEGVKETNRRLIVILANVSNFYSLFAKSNKVFDNSSSNNILDKWIISLTNKMIKTTTASLDGYDTPGACTAIVEYVELLSIWYVRRSRDRFRDNDKEAIQTLAYALDNVARVLAPIAPFISEEVYHSIRDDSAFANNTSVHLSEWPKFDASKINSELEENMLLVRAAVTRALDERKIAGIAVKQPLAKVTISGTSIPSDLFWLIEDELNVKKVEIAKSTGTDSEKESVSGTKEIKVVLDTKLTPELIEEGTVREIVRTLQDARKKAGLKTGEVVSISVDCSDKRFIEKYKSQIEQKTSTKISIASIEKKEKLGDIEFGFELKK